LLFILVSSIFFYIPYIKATDFQSSKDKMYCSSSKGNKDPKEKLSHESALELAKFLVQRDTSWELTSSAIDTNKPMTHKYHGSSDVSSTDEKVDKQGSANSLQPVELGGITPLFLATKSGCIEIVKEILEIYPQAVEHIDNEGRTILHVAIKYRQLEVFKLVLKMEEVPMRWLLRRLDNDGNSILHMVGIKIDGYVPEKMRGPALELQEEMLWFEVHFLVTPLSYATQTITINFCGCGSSEMERFYFTIQILFLIFNIIYVCYYISFKILNNITLNISLDFIIFNLNHKMYRYNFYLE
jgi:hypothetical protein